MSWNGKIEGMGQAAGLDAREATAALREATAARLRTGFVRVVEADARGPDRDARDATISLVPFVDCARRLGLDPRTVLGPLAATASRSHRDAFEHLVARTDLELGDFGWAVVETPDGPAYRFAWPDDRLAGSARSHPNT
jgi:hypothetical protein